MNGWMDEWMTLMMSIIFMIFAVTRTAVWFDFLCFKWLI